MKTLKEELREIKATKSMEIGQDASIRYQDMIGHSCQEDLAELANSEYKEEFYKVYCEAYGVIEAIKFFTHNSKKIADIIYQRDEFEANLADQKEKYQALKKDYLRTQDTVEQAALRLAVAEADLKKAQKENIELKAKLYDMMQGAA